MENNDIDIEDIQDVSSLLSKKWRMKVLCAVRSEGPYRFSELKRQFDISSKVLTACLNELTDAGLLDRTAHSSSHVTYELTEAGVSLLGLVDELNDWQKRHRRDSRPTVLVIDSNPQLADLFTDWLTPEYDAEGVSQSRQLDADRFRSADVVVFHYQPRAPIDAATIQRFDRREYEYRLVVVVATRRKVAECDLCQCAYLTPPILEETLSSRIRTALNCRSADG